MYTVLTGARKNIGDFLITDRCRKLLNKHRPEHKLFQLPAWESLEGKIDKINKSEAVIIMGGPGYRRNMYPGVYKLMPRLDEIKVPIIPMGLGWKGFPGDYYTLENYTFTDSAMELLNRIKEENKYVSCRDYLTEEALNRNGIENTLMTGCPVWYDLNSIGKEFNPPGEIKRVVFTPSQRHIYRKQSVKILKLLKDIFNGAKLYCSFHRGITADYEFTDRGDEKNNLRIKKSAEELGYEIVNAAFDLDNIRFYDQCDLHVGYRVHGHLYFLSKRKPSVLLHEDGRGRGVSEALNIKGIDAFERKGPGLFAERINIPLISWGIKKITGEVRPRAKAPAEVEDYIKEEIENGFLRFNGLGLIIDNYYRRMKKFISELP